MIARLLRWKRLFTVPTPLLGTLVHTAACRFQCGKVLLIGAFVLAGLLAFPRVTQAQQKDTLYRDRARQQRVEQLRQRREAEMRERMKERQKEIQARIRRTAAPPAPSGVVEQDSLALVALYNSTDGDNWEDNDGWLEESVSDWYGVAVSGDRVTSVDLSSNQLTGEIPPELSDLSNLESLWLGSNQLTGEIPPELSDLSALESLDLGYNQLTGEIPPELSDLSALESLDLFSNQLTGEIPRELSDLSNLSYLYLNSNQLTGEIPPELSDLSALESLGLSSNQLTGEIPPELSDLSNLESLDLSSNQLTGEIPPELSDLSNLESLLLDSNQLTGEIPPELSDLSNLKSLWLSSNQMTGEIPPELSDLSNLESLLLSSNQLTGEIPPELSDLSSLQSLDLTHNQLTGEIPPEFSDLSALESLSLRFNQLTEIPPELSDLSALESLDLGYNQLTEIPPELSDLSALESLDLSSNQLTEIPPELSDLSNLESLSLISNQLTGEIPPELSDLSNLESLYLFSNQLTGEIPRELSDLSNLSYLYLNSNQLTGEIPPELSDLSALESLGLSSNQLTGEIPPELSDLSALESLDLSSNQLTEIPPELSDLSALESLDLSSNQLTGEIPPELSDLSNLESLSLISNQLTGEIPPELSDLSNLESLYLFSNQLTGEIPRELSDLSNLSYLYLNSNQLTGAIPPSFINLTALSNGESGTFSFFDTNLCEPPDPDFQSWIDGIPNVQSTEMVCSEGIYTSEVPLASSFRMPIGKVKGGEDLGNNLTLLERGYWPESGYPNLRFNDDGDEDDTNEWYVATAHNKDQWSPNPFNGDTDPYSPKGHYHPGEDWNLTSGTDTDEGEPVLSVADGTVLHDGCVKNFGRTIILAHETNAGQFVTSFYAHLQDTDSFHSAGETVDKGDPLGSIGDTFGTGCSTGADSPVGVHLHFEIRKQSMLDSEKLSNGLIERRYGAGMWPATGRSDDGEYFIGANYYTPSDFIAARSEAAPTGLIAEVEDGEVVLSWDASPDADGYNVYRSKAPFSDIINDATKQNTSLLPEPNYTDTNPDSGTAYYYRVTAVNEDGNETPPSGQVSASLRKLKLLGLEVNQSVQTWENDVMPLVEGKKTIVRAHLQNKEEGSTPVNVRLKGTRNGSPLPDSPKQAYNVDNFEAPPSPSEDKVETIRKRRATMSGSLNFELPSEWLKETVTLSLVGSNLDCDETPAVNDNCELQVTFEPTGTPKITIFSIAWEDGSGTTHLPEYDINAIRDSLEAMYPVHNIDVEVGGTSFIFTCDKSSCDPPKAEDIIDKVNGNQVNDVLEGAFKIDNFYDESHMYLGLVSDTKDDEDGSEGPLGRANEIGGQVAFSVTNVERVPSIVAHEIAHLHGLRHATNEVFNGTNEDGHPLGWCGASDSEDREFPGDYLSTDIDIPEDNNGNEIWDGFIGIGPGVNASLAEEVWGINTRQRKGEQGKVIGTSPYTSSGANAELMSYCTDYNQGAPNIGALWPSDLTYAELREKINSYSGLLAVENSRSSSGVTSASLTASQEEDYLLVKGDVSLEDQSLQFRPFSTVTTTPDRADAVAPDSGNYSLQALNESGDVVEEVSFEPSIGVSKTVSDIGSFTIPVPADPAIEEVQVLGGGEGNSLSGKSGTGVSANSDVLGSKSASPNPPAVTVQYPNGGEDLSGDEVTLEWSADDADGDSLSYTVKYSRDDGSTWRTLTTSWPRDSLTVDASALGGTNDGLIRVQASDGFNTAQDESDDTFGTSNVPPSASIFSPSDGAVIGQAGTVALEGNGSDTEDGSLSGSALKWRTASGDSLGIGETIDIAAVNFSLGTHTIELVATDSVGVSDTASVSIQVSLSNDPSLLASASALVEADSLVGFGSTGTKIDFDSTSGAATVTTELYDSAPIGAGGIPESNVSHYRVLIDKQDGLTVGPGTTVRFETDTLSGIGDPTKVQIYQRSAPSNGPFAALDTQVDSMGTPSDPTDDEIYATTGEFGEFVLASNSEPLPVEFSSFEAILDSEDAVRLTWTTASETNNTGFKVQRKAGEAEEGSWTTVGSEDGSGTTTEPTSYRYVDEGLPYEADRLIYRLKQVDTDGSASYSKEVTVSREVTEPELLGTYPNPARTQATLRYAVPERQDVTIDLYDILGRRVQTVVDGEREGRHKRQLDTSRLASGVYFLRLTSKGETRTQKLTVVR